jgi:CheY-like chemotaxis protein/Tfp pilus assembly protein PilZ
MELSATPSSPPKARRPSLPPTAAAPHQAHALIFGALDPLTLRSLTSAAADARLTVHVERSLRDLDAALDRELPAVILVDGDRDIERTCLHCRYNPGLANVPLLGIADTVSDLGFEELFGAGGDDLVPRSSRASLVRRLRLLSADREPVSRRRRGTAVVVDPERRRRILLGRVLRNAGLDVAFALDASSALEQATAPNVEMVISAAALEVDGDSLARRARAAGIAVPWLVAAPPRDVARVRRLVDGLPRVAVLDGFGPPENVLFVGNDLVKGTANDARASARLLYGASVRFRIAGSDTDEIGYTYNLSAGGFYVRTLAPIPRGSETWLELSPPRGDRRVRLEGRVVWSRPFGTNEAATVPPGFAIQITGGSAGDLERYRRGYEAFASEVSGGR